MTVLLCGNFDDCINSNNQGLINRTLADRPTTLLFLVLVRDPISQLSESKYHLDLMYSSQVIFCMHLLLLLYQYTEPARNTIEWFNH